VYLSLNPPVPPRPIVVCSCKLSVSYKLFDISRFPTVREVVRAAKVWGKAVFVAAGKASRVDFGGEAIVKGSVLQSGACSVRDVVVGGVDFVD